MKKKTLILFLSAVLACVALAGDEKPKIAIIKADDLQGPTEKWKRFVDASRACGVKVSIGIICESLAGAPADYLGWIRDLDQSGQVEFWNHGWDHNRWTDEQGRKFSEFLDTGYDHQNKHYAQAKSIMTEVFGSPPVAFGAPYNAVDTDTVKVLGADGELRLFFGFNASGLPNVILVPLSLRGEHDGAGKPNYDKFRADYHQRSDLRFVALQFHPNNFSDEHFREYVRILEFLTSEGWRFVLPKEYLASQITGIR